MNQEIMSEVAAKEEKGMEEEKKVEEAAVTKEIEKKEGKEEKKKRRAAEKEMKRKIKEGKAQEKKKEADKKAAQKGQTRRASMILIKYTGDGCPDKAHHSSWKDPNGDIIGQRTKENAVAILEDLCSKVNSKTASFAEVAMEHSDCTSGKRGGDKGIFVSGEYRQVDKKFVETLFTLDVGQMSGIIENRSGVYIMMRTE